MDNPFGLASRPPCLLEGIKNQIRLHRFNHSPASDGTAENIRHKNDIYKPRPGGHIRNISDPELNGPIGWELTIIHIQCYIARPRGYRGDTALALAHPFEALFFRQPLCGTPPRRKSFSVQAFPDLTRTVVTAVLRPSTLNLRHKMPIAVYSGTASFCPLLKCFMAIVGGRCNR